VNVLVGDDMVQSSGVEGGRLYIWDIPMSRQLEMAVCQQALPHIHAGKCTTDLERGWHSCGIPMGRD